MKFAGACVYVDDIPAALEFYCRAFGFQTRFFDPQLQCGELDTGEARVAFASHALGEMLMPGRHPRGRPSGVEIAFITPDVSAAEPKAMPWGATVAYLHAPEGTLIGLSTPVSA